MSGADWDFEMGSACLLIIDMQNDFLSPEGYFAVNQHWPVERFRKMMEDVARLRREVKQAGGRVIYTATGYSPDGSDAYTNRHRILPSIFIEPDGRPRQHSAAVTKGSWGAEIIPALAPEGDDYVVHKRRFNAFYQTELEHMLRCWNIKTLIVTGVITEVCVESTVREAFIRDFDVLVVREGVGSWSKERHEASLVNMDFSYARVVGGEELLEKVKSKGGR